MANEVTRSTADLEPRDKRPLEEEGTRPGLVFRPDVDIVERSDAYLIYADMPGVDEKNVHVRLEKGVLTLDADLASSPDPSWNPIYLEYRFGGYHRQFRLSDEIDSERVSARMRDGVLELSLPKQEQHQPRQITVQAG